MKLFLAIAVTLSGVFLLFKAAVETVDYNGFDDHVTPVVFGVVLLAGGIVWLWKLRPFRLPRGSFAATGAVAWQADAHPQSNPTTAPGLIDGFCSNCGTPLTRSHEKHGRVRCDQCGHVFDVLPQGLRRS